MHNETNQAKVFLITFFSLLISGILLLIYTSYYIQPIQGDLTRLGGYSERDYGWNIPKRMLNDSVTLARTYDKYYDIVVLGDSFSNLGLWQSYLANDYNMTFTTLHWDNNTIESIINSQIFKDNPPKLFIIELGTRSFPIRFTSSNSTCNSEMVERNKSRLNLEVANQHSSFSYAYRNTYTKWNEVNLKFALLYLENSLLRMLIKNDFSKVMRYDLTRNDLFSNKNNDSVLLLSTWFDSKVWSDEEISKAICSVIDIQNKVQSNGRTLFILLPIPDKSSAYKKYIKNPSFSDINNISIQLANSKINTPKIELLIAKAIDAGDKDVYLPNDTHFGTIGYELVAKSIKDLLANLKK